MSIQWSLVIFTLLTGAGGCLAAFAGLNEITKWSKKSGFMAGLVALILAAVGGIASVTHLSHPDRIMGAFSHPTSGIFVEAVLVGILGVCLIVYLIGVKRNQAGLAKVFGILAGIAGLVLSFMAGHSYIMAAQTAWNTMLLPLAYLATALAMGAGLWWALQAPDKENGGSVAALLTAIFAAVGAIALVAYCAKAGSFGALGICAIVCEVLALAVGIIGRGKPSATFAWIAVIAACIAGLLFRMLMWTVGGTDLSFFG